MSEQSVPQIDLNAPLPVSDEVVVDTVMIRAKREWVVGIGVFVIFLAGVGAIGWGYSRTISESVDQKISESVSQQVSQPVASALPVASIKPIFAVWNASGVAGAAGKMAETLKVAGYEVVETKNAPKEKVGTTIELDEKMLGQKDQLMTVVGAKDYELLKGVDLGYNARVILGK